MNKNFSKILAILLICLSVMLSAYTFNPVKSQKKPGAINGVMDLTNWNWSQDGIVALNGEWEFYWNQLLTPDDIKKSDASLKRNLISLPRAWNKYIINGDKLPGDGYATYRLVIKNSSDEIMGIKLPRIFTSYRLWINGELTAYAGKIDTDGKHMTPQYLPQVKYIDSESQNIDMVIQVANFKHRSGGILESIHIGTASQITEVATRNLTLELFLFGSLFIIGFYHIALYIFRTKDKSALYFGIYSILISARTLLVGEIYLIHLFPRFSWEIAHKIQTLSYYIGVPLVLLFMKSVFPKEVSSKVNRFIVIIGGAFSCLVLLTPAKIFTYFNPFYQSFSIGVILYILYIVLVTSFKKREGAYLIGFGVTILILFSLNDIIFLSIVLADSSNHFLRGFVTRGNLSSLGLLAFVFTQSLVLAKKFSKSYSNVELLTEELQQLNMSLEKKVGDRTRALETSREELKIAYQAVTRSEKSLKTLIQNISHDLRTPLAAVKGYANALLDEIFNEPEQQKKCLTKIVDKVDFLNNMVGELLDFSQLQSRQIKLLLTEVPLNQFLKNISDKQSIDMINKRIIYKFHYSAEPKNETLELDSLFVIIDPQKMERALANLFSNAVKYTPDGGSIEVFIKLLDNNQRLIVEISDTGIGISKEDIEYIFERFYTTSEEHQKDSKSLGLGLAIVKEIIEYHNGEVWVESEVSRGSQFFLSLPVYNRDNLKEV